MRAIALLLLLLTLAGCASAAPADPRVAASAALLSDYEPDEPGCSAAVGRDGEVVWAGAAGLADLDGGEPLTVDSVMDFASISKQFTATAILMLQQQSLLSTGDTLATWVGGLPEWADRVTLGDLVHHTSGIPDYVYILDAGDDEATTNADVNEVLAQQELGGDPGTYFEYSNSNYVLLAEVVEAATGMTLPQWLAANVSAPSGSSSSTSRCTRAPEQRCRTGRRAAISSPRPRPGRSTATAASTEHPAPS